MHRPGTFSIMAATTFLCTSAQSLMAQTGSHIIVPASSSCPLKGVAGMALDKQGGVFVADPPDRIVCRFGIDGRLRSSFGSQGEGLAWPIQIGTVGDTVWVFDSELRQIRLFSPAGVLRGSMNTPQLMSSCRLLHGGAILAVTQPLPESAGTASETIAELLPNGVTKQLATLTHRVVALTFRSDSMGATFHQPFSDEPLWTLDPSGRTLVVVQRSADRRDPSVARIMSIDVQTGDTIRVQDVAGPRLEITDADVEAEVAQIDRKLHVINPALRVHLTPDKVASALFRPRFRPPFVALVIGTDGALWLQNAAPHGAPVSWTVLSRSQRHVVRAEFPNAILMAANGRSFWTVVVGSQAAPTIYRKRWQ